MQEAKKLGLQTVPWTIDDEASISDAIQKGVSAVISNYPDRVLAVARKYRVKAGKEGVPVPDKCLANGGSTVLGKTRAG